MGWDVSSANVDVPQNDPGNGREECDKESDVHSSLERTKTKTTIPISP